MIGLHARRKFFISHATFPNRSMVNYSRIIEEVMVLMKKPFVSEYPPPAGHQNVPQMGSCGDRSLRRRKSIFVDPLIFFLYFREYIGEGSRSGGAREATSLPSAATPWWQMGGLWAPCSPPGLALKLPDLLPFRKNLFRGFYSVWTPFQNQI